MTLAKIKLEAKARLSASSQVTAAGLESLPPRKRAVTEQVSSILAEAGLDPKFQGIFEGTVTLEISKGMPFLSIAKLLKNQFTFHGANHGTKGFMAYNFSEDGKSPFVVCGWNGGNEVTISQTRTQWTPKNADLPEYSILAIRQNLEAMSGVKLKPVISKRTGALTLRGALGAKQTRNEVLESLKRAGKMKSLRVKSRSGATVDRPVIYIPKAEAIAMVVLRSGGGMGPLELTVV